MKNFLIDLFEVMENSFYSEYFEKDLLRNKIHKKGNISILLYNTNLKKVSLIFDFEKEILQINFYMVENGKLKRFSYVVLKEVNLIDIYKELKKYRKHNINFSIVKEIRIINLKYLIG